METYSTDFLRSMRTLTRWFRKRDFTEDQLELWWDRVGHIPDRIFGEIVNQVIDTSKYMPTPAEVKSLYGEYRRQHRDRFIPSEQTRVDCDRCNSTGIIVAWKVRGGYPYEYAIACGHCENWRRVFPTRPSGPPANIVPPKRMTIGEILEAGFILDDPWEEDSEPKAAGGRYDSLDDMADAAGNYNEIPF